MSGVLVLVSVGCIIVFVIEFDGVCGGGGFVIGLFILLLVKKIIIVG